MFDLRDISNWELDEKSIDRIKYADFADYLPKISINQTNLSTGNMSHDLINEIHRSPAPLTNFDQIYIYIFIFSLDRISFFCAIKV